MRTNLSRYLDATPLILLSQTLIRATMQEQKEATRLGLQAAQIASNKAALEALVKEKEEEVAKAKADFQDGMLGCSHGSSTTLT